MVRRLGISWLLTIEKLGGAELILTGYQASDVEEGLVGAVIAEELRIPCVTIVSEVEVEAMYHVKVTSESEVGHAVVDIPFPAVCTIISSEKNVPRLPKVRDVRQARSKPIQERGRRRYRRFRFRTLSAGCYTSKGFCSRSGCEL